jgi:dienelactone hydrolase
MMKKKRKIFKWLVLTSTTVLVLAGLTLAAVALIPFSPIHRLVRPIPDQTAYKLDEKVGVYRNGDGRELMVTWGSYGGLTVNEYAPVAGGDLVPLSADACDWKPYSVKEEYRVTFRRDPAGNVTGMSWADAKGQPHSAARLERPPYEQAEVRFRNGGVELVGLLLTPAGPGPHPGVVFVHGSGTSIRDYLCYLQTADYLARHGCVVLVPDKRGSGKSGGDWLTSSFADYADDALAGVGLLAGVAAVDPQRIGLLGVSQGGWILPLAAARSGRVRFIVSYSGSATVLDDTMRYENAQGLRDSGVPRWLVPVVEPAIASQIRKNHGSFWKLNGWFDPLPYWQKLAVPALVLNGELDKNVPVAKSTAILEAVRRLNPKAEITIRVFPGCGHGMEDPRTRGIREDCLALTADWIGRVTL